MSPQSIIQERRFGEIRIAVVSEVTGDLSRVLQKCGLRSDPTMLVEHPRDEAEAILRELLWKDMAYEGECMPRERAALIARAILAENSVTCSRFFSNGNWARRESWNPLTESTFDAGLLVSLVGGQYFCIWFQDED